MDKYHKIIHVTPSYLELCKQKLFVLKKNVLKIW